MLEATTMEAKTRKYWLAWDVANEHPIRCMNSCAGTNAFWFFSERDALDAAEMHCKRTGDKVVVLEAIAVLRKPPTVEVERL